MKRFVLLAMGLSAVVLLLVAASAPDSSEGFAIKIQPTELGLVLTCDHGCAWEKLEMNCSDIRSCIFKIEEQGGSVIPGLDKADNYLTPEFVLGGIESGVERSPYDYIAALVEVTGPPQCEEIRGEEVCHQENVIIKLFAANGNRLSLGDSFRVLGEGRVGSRYILFAVPSDPGLGIYGATFSSRLAGEAEQRNFADAIRRAGI